MPGFTYKVGDHSITSPRKLNDGELEELFAPPLSERAIQDPVVRQRMAGQQAGLSLLAKRIPQALRIGGLFGGPLVSAGADIAAQGIELATGQREKYRPIETITEAGLAKAGRITKLVEGATALGSTIKGAVFGGSSATLISLARGQGLPTVGQVALGITFGGGAGAGASLLRNATREILDRDSADLAHSLLSGEKLPGDVSLGIRDSAAELKQFRLGIEPPRGRLTPIKYKYRTSTGQFTSSRIRELKSEPVGEEILQDPDRAKFEDLDQERLPLTRTITKPTKGVPTEGIPTPRTTTGTAPPVTEFDRIQQVTGLPVYSQIYQPGQRAVERAERLHGSIMEGMEHPIPLPHRGMEKVQAWLETPEVYKNDILKAMNMSSSEKVAATRMKVGWDRIARTTGLDMNRYLTEYLPAIRRAEGNIEEAFPLSSRSRLVDTDKWFSSPNTIDQGEIVNLPPEVQYFRSHLNADNLDPTETHALAMLSQHARAVARETHIAPLVNKVRSAFSGKIDERISGPVNRYINEISGQTDALKRDLGTVMSRWLSKIPGVNLTTREARNWVDDGISLQYSGTLGSRPGPIINNSLQPIQTAYMYVGRFLKTGMKEAYTSKGKELANELGLTTGQAGISRELSELSTEGGGFRGGLRRTSRKSLRLYGKVDDRNRAASGIAGYRKVQWAAARAEDNATKFADLADLTMLRASEAQDIMKLYAGGNKQEAFRRYAVAIADDSQYPYTAGTRPYKISGTGGKLFGAYAYWPLYYADQLVRMSQMPDKRGLAFARFALANSALVGTMGTIAAVAGVEHPYMRQLSRFWLGPLGYTGSPPLELLVAAGKSVDELVRGEIGGSGQKAFLRSAEAFIPRFYLIKDFEHLMENVPQGIARFLSAAPGLPTTRSTQ